MDLTMFQFERFLEILWDFSNFSYYSLDSISKFSGFLRFFKHYFKTDQIAEGFLKNTSKCFWIFKILLGFLKILWDFSNFSNYFLDSISKFSGFLIFFKNYFKTDQIAEGFLKNTSKCFWIFKILLGFFQVSQRVTVKMQSK